MSDNPVRNGDEQEHSVFAMPPPLTRLAPLPPDPSLEQLAHAHAQAAQAYGSLVLLHARNWPLLVKELGEIRKQVAAVAVEQTRISGAVVDLAARLQVAETKLAQPRIPSAHDLAEELVESITGQHKTIPSDRVRDIAAEAIARDRYKQMSDDQRALADMRRQVLAGVLIAVIVGVLAWTTARLTAPTPSMPPGSTLKAP